MSVESTSTDPYDIVLADLRAKKAQIEQVIGAIEALRGGAPSAAAIAPAGQTFGAVDNEIDSPGAFLGLSITDAAKKLLAAKRRPLRNPEIAAAFKRGGLVLNSKDVVNTIGAVLTRRANEIGDLVKVDRGTWGLKEWYPGRSFKKGAEVREKTDEIKATVATNFAPAPPPPPTSWPPSPPPPPPAPRPPPPPPILITSHMREKLRENGASEEDIRDMSFAEAQSYLNMLK